MTQTYHFSSALIENQWQDNVAISVSATGLITSVQLNVSDGIQTGMVAVPGMVNVHSHAFQRAFAGLSEYRTAGHDSFWTWRKLMYEFLQQLTPADVYVVARQLYLEMLTAGYTWVGEFHYLHNSNEGTRYSNLPEMSDAIIRAAADAGIGLCLLPVLYQQGGFDATPLSGGQLRFELSNDEFVQVVNHCRNHQGPNYRSGVALHSLRAVTTESGNRVIADLTSDEKTPFHIHVAEQMQEVNACLAYHEKRPVEYLYDNFSVDENWCLIHATHLSDSEVSQIAGSGAVVGLCPTTEANLGDGFFAAEDYLAQNGRIAIGSDSHCSVDWSDELRTLEYGQRLRSQRRAILGTEKHSVGRRLFDSCSLGGAQAIGLNAGIRIGGRADFTLIDPQHPAIAGCVHDRLLDRAIFCNAGDPIGGAIVGGTLFDRNSDEFKSKFASSSSEFLKLSKKLIR